MALGKKGDLGVSLWYDEINGDWFGQYTQLWFRICKLQEPWIFEQSGAFPTDNCGDVAFEIWRESC